MGRRVLVLGGGGREHALGLRLAESDSVDRVESAPGNPGLADLGPIHDVDPTDGEAVSALAAQRGIDLVVVGPEAPLVAGVADVLAQRDVPVFGPSAAAARLEGSKAFAREMMAEADAPSAGYVSTSNRAEAHEALDRFGSPYVVKADGLAAGKGVRVCHDLAAAREAVDDALVRRVFGDAGANLVIEEFLDGPERSVFGVCDGTDVTLLAPARDYKRAEDGDAGPNTGGMGAYGPVEGFGLGDAEVQGLAGSVFRPVLQVMADRGMPFRGLLYAGLAVTDRGPRLIEFNVRFGDPETQVVLPRLASDLGDLLWASATGSLADVVVDWHDDAFVTVVLASGGYPGDYQAGVPIRGVDAADARDDAHVVHAGTARTDDRLVTAGGRVLDVVGRGADVDAARAAAYAAADEISFDGLYRRSDIAAAT
ncbi:phosphoribosylamine--glycine ligase [Salsipaludibacter albus]|uniref:phosphoribosylamine--glycine ligase n=1 Tax=Salsipaludibacter albus TaxID=2849650 RepID=UPI001EE4E1D8|nr:phosphoribosylamine--glycine ligase [Salsipaludibacter albus]MBY5161183.1 phosphoribosylamine--glycine ligase [Salsipaludibacter albus]